jgi:imidazolonepropionase-like amidohydrolase
MKATISLRSAACALALAIGAAGAPALAQDLVITNARILDGAGGEIANGTIVVEDGVIASVGEGGAPAGAENVIDASGKTVMPGFIDSHRHIGQATPEEMKAFIDAGFTTVMDALSFNLPAYQEIRRKIEAGEEIGPRLKFSALVPVNATANPVGVSDAARADPARIPLAERDPVDATPPEQARAMVDQAAEQGADNIKIILVASPKGDDIPTLQAIADEAHQKGMRMIVHATSVTDAVEAAEGGTDLFAHTPHIGWVDEGDALEKIVANGSPMSTTLGVFTPYWGPDGDKLFRDFMPFPNNVLHSAGQGPVNERLLWDAGVTIGYGTDTTFAPRDSLRHELRALSSVFGPAELVTILTKNAAICADVDDITGVIEPGKQADLVMVDGDPLDDIFATLNVKLVVKGGEIVSDQR